MYQARASLLDGLILTPRRFRRFLAQVEDLFTRRKWRHIGWSFPLEGRKRKSLSTILFVMLVFVPDTHFAHVVANFGSLVVAFLHLSVLNIPQTYSGLAFLARRSAWYFRTFFFSSTLNLLSLSSGHLHKQHSIWR